MDYTRKYRKLKYKCDGCGEELHFYYDYYVCYECGLLHKEIRIGSIDTYITSDLDKKY